MLRMFMLALLLMPYSSTCFADTVTCHDGRVFEGEIIEDTPEQVRIRTRSGILTLPRNEVKSSTYQSSPLSEHRERRKKLADDDAKGRWELALFCEQNDLKRECEQLLEEIRSMASQFYVQATMKLGEILAPKDPKRAIKILDELASRSNELKARTRSLEIKSQLDQKRKNIYEQAKKEIEQKKLEEALETLRFAYNHSYAADPEHPQGAPTEEEIVLEMVELRMRLQERVWGEVLKKSVATDTEKKLEYACGHCKGSGFATCERCKGSTTITVTTEPVITPKGMRPGQKVQVECPDCKKRGLTRCGRCTGSGLNLELLDHRARFQLKIAAEQAWRTQLEPLSAMEIVTRAVRREHLSFEEGFKPSYVSSRVLRELLPEVPVPTNFRAHKNFQAFAKLWNEAGKTPEVRANFLFCYALEAALLGPATVIPDQPPDLKPQTEPIELEKLAKSAPQCTPTELSALPELWHGNWVWVEGRGLKPEPLLEGSGRRGLKIEGQQPSNLFGFYFLPEASSRHADGVKAGPNDYLKTLLNHYPYRALAAELQALEPGSRMRLFGRVFHRKARDPETLLEIWKVEPLQDERIEKLLALIRKPVTFHFEETDLTEALQLLALFSNTRIKLDLGSEPGLTVSARATQQPLGKALTILLLQTGYRWVFAEEGQELHIVKQAQPAQHELVERILKLLK